MHIPLWQHLFANFQQKHLGKTDGPTAVLRQETSLSCAVLRPQRSTDFPSFDSFQPNFCLFRLYLENITFYLSFQGNLSCFNNFTQFLGIVQKYNLYAIYFCFLLVAPERIPYQIIHEIWTLEAAHKGGGSSNTDNRACCLPSGTVVGYFDRSFPSRPYDRWLLCVLSFNPIPIKNKYHDCD